MAKIFLTKLPNGDFRPTFDKDREKARRIDEGGHIQVRYEAVRNPKQHRKYWALINEIASNSDVFVSPELIHKRLKVATGRFKVFEVGGKVITELESMDYANMDRDAFEAYYTDAVNAAAELYGDWVREIEANSEHA